jgi:Family of unknown function (DUF6521)
MAQYSDKYLFNNTAIGLVGILSTIQHTERIDLANALLINPFLLHSETLKFILTPNIKLRGLEEFLEKAPKLLVNFPERYQSLLTMNFNCLAIGVESDYLRIEGDYIYPTPKLLQNKIHKSRTLGIRANEILRASIKLEKILQTNSTSLYLNLRIVL